MDGKVEPVDTSVL